MSKKNPLEVKFIMENGTRYLYIANKQCRHYMTYEKNEKPVEEKDLKSIIIDRNVDFVNALSSRARQNLIDLTGENALTWNFFRTIIITKAWNFFFNTTDLISGRKIAEVIPENPSFQDSFFWNIRPGSDKFNPIYARKIFYEDISLTGPANLIEPDFLAYFNEFTLLVESKLKSGFDTCHRLTGEGCEGKKTCNHFLNFISNDLKGTGFTAGPSKENHCFIYNQLMRNLRMATLLSPINNISHPAMINILNEKSPNYKTNLQKCKEFTAIISKAPKDFRQFHIFTITWQEIRKNLGQLIKNNETNDSRLRKLYVYLSRHPDL